MPENTTITPIVETTVSTNTVVSPAVAVIIENAHAGAVDVISLFEANQVSLISYYWQTVKWVLDGVFGKPTSSKKLSELVDLKRQLHEREAANDKQGSIAA